MQLSFRDEHLLNRLTPHMHPAVLGLQVIGAASFEQRANNRWAGEAAEHGHQTSHGLHYSPTSLESSSPRRGR
jgi:hypothetical protein